VTNYPEVPTDGWGFLASLEGGYPIPLWFWPRLVLEPQGQIIWQRVKSSIALTSTIKIKGLVELS
jgi:outer membrane autotransporter protein